MKLLAIDTSTERASVALAVGQEIQSREHQAPRQHAQFLLPVIDELLSEAGLTVSQLDGIVFGRGPGSFTGLRIACSIVKGLAYAHDLAVYPVSSLLTIAHEAFFDPDFQKNDAVLAMIDARMNQIYWAGFTQSQEEDEFVTDPSAVSFQNEGAVILAGVGIASYRALLPQSLKEKIKKELSLYPEAKTMLKLACSGQLTSVGIDDAMPVYIRNEIVQRNV